MPHRHRAGLRLLAAAVSALLLVTVALAGDLVVLGIVLVVLTGIAALVGGHDLYTSFAFYGSCVLTWLMSGASATSWWCIPIAVELLIIHVARTLALIGPDDAPLPRPLTAAWARRTAWVAAATVAVGAAGVSLAGGAVGGTTYAAAGLLFVLMVGLALLPRLYSGQESDRES